MGSLIAHEVCLLSLLKLQQHLSSLLLTKSICDRCLKILQHLSSSNLPSLVLDNCLKIDQIIYSELQMIEGCKTA